jgi:hypothetical protein
MGAPPIGAKNAEQLLGQHDIAILPALAAADVDHHPGAVDILDRERRRFRHAQPGGVDRHKRGSELKVAHGLQETLDFISRKNGWQCIGPAPQWYLLRHCGLAERRSVKEPQGTHILIDGLHSEAAGIEMQSILAHMLERKLVRRLAKMSTEVLDRANVSLLGQRRHVADRHVIDHTSPQR